MRMKFYTSFYNMSLKWPDWNWWGLEKETCLMASVFDEYKEKKTLLRKVLEVLIYEN